jgi:RsiW-degrading membrane proteinase PrsW (M82 family)
MPPGGVYPPPGNYPPASAVPPYLYPGYPGMSYPYGYGGPGPMYPYGQPPRRDGYLLFLSIISFIGSILSILGGLVCLGLLLFMSLVSSTATGQEQQLSVEEFFGGVVSLIAYSIAGIVGGGFCLYHSIRSLFLQKPSGALRLPRAWIFFGLYVLLIAGAFILGSGFNLTENYPLAVVVVLLAGALPAIGFTALAVHYTRDSSAEARPITWRRFALALTSGGTLALLVALILEALLMVLTALALRVDLLRFTDLENLTPTGIEDVALVFIIVAVIAPVVEELVKPLSVSIMAGRLHSAAEAFVLGFACGLGFNLVETSSYISMMGAENWLDIALQRSTTGLLHGFGSAMVGLGWYYMVKDRTIRFPVLVGLGCIVYAILQHALWNGTFLVATLPAPVGPYLAEGMISIGSYQLPAILLVYLVETLLMFAFFLHVMKCIRMKKSPFSFSRKKQPAMSHS